MPTHEIPPPPVEVPVPAPAPVVVTPAQVWSAAAQNVAIVAAVTAAYFMGKCPMELWLAVLGYVGGIDILGRRIAKSNPAMALAIGSTGALLQFGRLLTLTALVVSFATAQK